MFYKHRIFVYLSCLGVEHTWRRIVNAFRGEYKEFFVKVYNEHFWSNLNIFKANRSCNIVIMLPIVFIALYNVNHG